MKKLGLLFLLVCFNFSTNAQTTEALKKELAPKKAKIAKLQGEVNAIQAKIDGMPGWRKGAFGTIGGSFSGFSNWYSRTAPNAVAGNIGITVNGFANLIEEEIFWRNSGAVHLGWVKLDNKEDATDSGNFETATDVFTISSLFGKRLNKKWALSALGEYRTTLIDNFNNPGFLDIGIGMTWTPLEKLVVAMHPANYNIIFSSGERVYTSSSGAKIVADYTANYHKLSIKSNLSVFQSYKDRNLSNWTWTNSLGYTLWKGIGVGLELGLRNNKQEALNNALANFNTTTVIPTPASPTFKNIDNKLQSYYLLGLNYAF